MRRARVSIIMQRLLALVRSKNTDKAGEDKTLSNIASRLKKDKDKTRTARSTGKGPELTPKDVQRAHKKISPFPKGGEPIRPTGTSTTRRSRRKKRLGGRIFNPDEKTRERRFTSPSSK